MKRAFRGSLVFSRLQARWIGKARTGVDAVGVALCQRPRNRSRGILSGLFGVGLLRDALTGASITAASMSGPMMIGAGTNEAAAQTLPSQQRVEFDLESLSRVPEIFPVEASSPLQRDGVRALYFRGPDYRGNATRVFAYYGVPTGSPESGGKFPAMVLIHGGGGTAFDSWVKLWTSRGYAAIAMDLCGCVPNGTYGNWQRDEQGGPAGWDASFGQVDEPLTDQWTWHAVSNVALAHSLIRSFPEVDADRIGVTGISWGGYLTSIVAGVDSRFQCAVPVYGCGFLGENSAWLPAFESMGSEKAGRWLSLWDPSHYLKDARMPMLWVNGTNDFAYPMDSWQKSYRLPAAKSTLCLRVRMPHGHGPAGENPEEIHVFANAHLKQGMPLATITQHGTRQQEAASQGSKTAWALFESSVPIVDAELAFTRDRGPWPDRKWEQLPAAVDAKTGEVSALVPEDATVYYLNIFDDRHCAISAPHEESER